MKKTIKKAIYNKTTAKLFIPLLMKLHNLCYAKISRFAVIQGDGVHPKHKLMKYHDFFINNITTDDTVLDIGCGIGANAFDIAKKAKKVVGVELSKQNYEYAKKHNSSENIEYVYGDATKDLGDEKFDVIVLSNVLEHIKERVEFLKNIAPLAPKLLIRVPMIDRDWLVLYKKEMGVESRLDDTHFTEYTMKAFKNEIREANLVVKDFSIQFGEIWAIVEGA